LLGTRDVAPTSSADFKGMRAEVDSFGRLLSRRLLGQVSDSSEPDRDGRRKLIAAGRSLAINSVTDREDQPNFRDVLEASAVYFQLRPHLSTKFNESMNGRIIIIPPAGSKMPGLAHKFLGELDRLEREWSVGV
jgi:hypothetical protein